MGGSDAAPALGMSRFRTPYGLWLEKRGLAAPLIESEPMKWGKLLEDAVAREAARQLGGRARKPPREEYRHPEHSWMYAHPDRLFVPSVRQRADAPQGLECKTANTFLGSDFGEPGTDQVPDDYLLQCLHYLAVTGWGVWHLAVLIGGQRFALYKVERDEEAIADLIRAEARFWRRVETGDAPEIDGSPEAGEYLMRRFRDTGTEVEMTDELEELALQYDRLRTAIKAGEAEQETVGNRIRAALGDNARARRGNVRVSWSTVTQRRLDTKALIEALPGVVDPYMVDRAQRRLDVRVSKEA